MSAPKITPIPVIPGGGGGGGGGTPPAPGVNYSQLLYRLLFPYYTPGGLQGEDDYFTLQTAVSTNGTGKFNANTYQRLYGDADYTQRWTSLFMVVNLSSDTLTLSWGQAGKPPGNQNAKPLGALGSGNNIAVYPASDMGQMWIQGPNGSDAYLIEWYAPSTSVTPQ